MLWGLFHPQTNTFHDPSNVPVNVPPNPRFESILRGDERRSSLEMAKNVADVAAAARRNGNHGARAQTEGSVKTKTGLRFERFFTPPGSHAYDLVEWERRTAAITSEKGQIIFEQKDVEV